MHANFSSIQDWMAAFGVILIGVAAVEAFRWMLRRWSHGGRFSLVARLAPTFSYFIYVVAFRVFVDIAPLHPRLAVWLNDAVYIAGVVVVLALLQRAATLAIEWSAFRTNPSDTLQRGFIPLMKNIVTIFAFTVGSIMILKHLNYDVMSLVAALGVSSLAVGLAAKDTLSNMISGFTLIIDRNLRPGDRINLGGQAGEVEEIGLRSTRIRTGNGNTLIVPNSELVNTKILNLSQPSRAVAVTVPMRFPLTVGFDRIRASCLEIASQVPQAQKTRSATCLIAGLSEQTQLVNTIFWIEDLDQEGAAVSAFLEKLGPRLEREHIAYAVPPVMSFPK